MIGFDKRYLFGFILYAIVLALFFPVFKAIPVSAANYTSSAGAMIIMEQETGLVVAEKNANEKRRMASTTKILTAITAIESGVDLDKNVKVHPKAAGIEGSSIYLKKNELISMRDLLYGLMLRSGNDAAVAIAYEIGGSAQGFSKMMNDKAREIGAVNSNFINPHGLDANDHYTTAKDLALITCHAMKNPVFREISKTEVMRTKATENSAVRLFVNKNKILRTTEGGVGVKTGFTKKAGRCLVSAVERDGLTFVAVVLNCGPMFEESAALLNSAHGEYMRLFADFDKMYGVEVSGSEKGVYNAKTTQKSFEKVIKRPESEDYIIKEILFENLSASLKKGTPVGVVKVLKKNEVLFESDILLEEDAMKKLLSFEEIFMELLK